MERSPAKPLSRRGFLGSLTAAAAATLWDVGPSPLIAAPVTIAVIMSSDADEYKEALRGFNETASHQIVAVYDINGDLQKGRKALAEIERKGRPDLIYAIGTWALQAIAGQTTIPVVYAM